MRPPFRRGRAIAVAVALLAALPAVPVPGPSGPLAGADAPAWWSGLLLRPDATGATPLAGGSDLALTVTLEPRDAAGLALFDRALVTPGSGEFGRYLTEAEFLARFAPPVANATTVSTYFRAAGATDVMVAPDREAVSFALPEDRVAEAFGTELGLLRGPGGETVRVALASPRLPAGLSEMVAGVSGLTGPLAPRAPPARIRGPAAGPATPFFLNGSGVETGTQWFVGSDYLRLYDEGPLLPGSPSSVTNATYAGGEVVATILESGYNESAGTNLPPWDPAVVDAYFNATLNGSGLPPPSALIGIPVTVTGVTPPAAGPAGKLSDDSDDVVENELDLEMAGSLAPGAELQNYYIPASVQYSGSGVTDGALADDFANALSQALSSNDSPRRLAAVSASFGMEGLNDTFWNEELAHAAALGVTVVASSGDSGDASAQATSAYLGNGPGWPADAAFDGAGTISVGGASVTSSGAATGSFDFQADPPLAYDPSVGTITAQSVWYDTLGGTGNITGSEGGGAVNYSEPSWQYDSAAQPAVAAAEGVQGLTALARAGPDVAFAANDTLALTEVNDSGAVVTPLEGTSIAAPLFAGMLAEMSAVIGHPFGFIDPALYRIGSYYAAHPGASDPFLDVTKGANAEFSAGVGWDAATGWGGIDAARFLAAYSNATIANYTYDGPTPGISLPAEPGASGISLVGAVLLGAVGALLVGFAVLWVMAPRRRSAFPPPVPGNAGPVRPILGPAFDCPYCGRPRPADAVPCPTCGRL